MAKNNLITVSAYRSSREAMETDLRCKRPRFADVYELYQKKLKQSSVMDFDDILLNMNYLLKDNPDALQSISSKCSGIIRTDSGISWWTSIRIPTEVSI